MTNTMSLRDRKFSLMKIIANIEDINDLYEVLMQEIKEIENRFPDVPKWYNRVK